MQHKLASRLFEASHACMYYASKASANVVMYRLAPVILYHTINSIQDCISLGSP